MDASGSGACGAVNTEEVALVAGCAVVVAFVDTMDRFAGPAATITIPMVSVIYSHDRLAALTSRAAR